MYSTTGRGKNYTIIFITVIFILMLISCDIISIQTKVDEYMDKYLQIGNFSGVILIALDGRIVLSKGYGMANLEDNVPIIEDTKFLIGSITKTFTAVSIIQLEEDGLLSVNDSIVKYIPDYPEGKRITIHHLLTHTSGIPDLTEFDDFGVTMMIPSTVSETIERFISEKLEFQPGEKYRYSNSNYILLGYIIEKVSGMKYEDYLEDNILQPLGMRNTGYYHNRQILEGRAEGYTLREGELIRAPYIDMSVPHASGALFSTAEDLYIWDRALYKERLAGRENMDRLFEPYKGNYGYGWEINELFGHKMIGHSGGIYGFSSSLSRFVDDDDVCIILLSNLEYAPLEKINRDIAAIIFGEDYELPVVRSEIRLDTSLYNNYTGIYQLTNGKEMQILRKEDKLLIRIPGKPEYAIFPESEDIFFFKITDEIITFKRDSTGRITGFTIREGDGSMEAERVERE